LDHEWTSLWKYDISWVHAQVFLWYAWVSSFIYIMRRCLETLGQQGFKIKHLVE